jgi:exopolysaccharide biosynthesis protein
MDRNNNNDENIRFIRKRNINEEIDRQDEEFTEGKNRYTGYADYESENYPARRQSAGKKNVVNRTKAKVLRLFIIDFVIAAFLFLCFSLYYFILPRDLSGEAITLPTTSASQSSVQNSAKTSSSKPNASSPSKSKPSTASTQASAVTSADPNSWRVKFADKFTSGDVQKTDSSYKSANINVSVQKKTGNGVTYYVADIYVADIKYFKTAFASGKYSSANGLPTDKIAQKNNAIIAINGDNSPENVGPIVRNGQLYKNKAIMDVLVMNNDGSMQTFSPNDFDINKLQSEGAWQAWTFGPMLLKDGQVMDTFNSGVKVANPRTAIGYYEPGHYCFVVVDGRQAGYSTGLSCAQMSQLFYDMGCKAAFNLDGGQSTEMAYMGKLVNRPYNGGRAINDIVYIADE